ncbi:SIMPL domain-containing protein [Proteiniclasticum sp.]|uniref:SIMPL domain-containing protein n=1 Tax=Proteiniclasticum sp. TaxID=2053595 RepID=UPI0028A298DF|nr:SIMPL domain-containing protein [Proteiniclasticum sp.]
MDNTIRVEGKGIIRRRPDVIQLSFNLKFEDEKYQEALELYNEGYENFIGAVTEAGLPREEMKTANLHVGTHYEQEHDGRNYRSVFKGYLITSNLYLEMPMDLSLLSRVVEKIAGRGTTPEFTITFGIKDEDRDLDEALREAALDAKKKASVLAETMGFSLGHVKSVVAVSEDSIIYHSRVEMPREMKAMEMDISPREVEIERKVEVVFEIL